MKRYIIRVVTIILSFFAVQVIAKLTNNLSYAVDIYFGLSVCIVIIMSMFEADRGKGE